MKMSTACRQQVTEPSEGKRLTAYKDCVGVWTIGYGHTSRAGMPIVFPGMAINDAQADIILSRDLATFEDGVTQLVAKAKQPVTQNEFDALVDLAFNIGLGNFRTSSLLRAYLAGDKTTAARKFMDWNKAGGRVVGGLTQRRIRDQAWFNYGKLPPARLGLIAQSDFVGEQAHEVDHADNVIARTWNNIFAPQWEYDR